ncbi:hypothetical protein [Streptomyces californicus]|uniref:hypothetical protein n=1 Tax=Streptomyces californicus TaxID=67351 RepID=UPI0037B985BF
MTELLLSHGPSATVRLTHQNAHENVHLEDGHAVRVPTADHLTIRNGLHELARILTPLTRTGEWG